jgi:Lrp/AsnC family transcriptional regulator for asnA, asnC and gidA
MVGYGVMAEVFIETEQGKLREVAEKAARFQQVSYVACTTGEKDVIISVRARSIEELFNFITEELGKIPGVRHTESYLMPLKIKDFARWLPKEPFERKANVD